MFGESKAFAHALIGLGVYRGQIVGRGWARRGQRRGARPADDFAPRKRHRIGNRRQARNGERAGRGRRSHGRRSHRHLRRGYLRRYLRRRWLAAGRQAIASHEGCRRVARSSGRCLVGEYRGRHGGPRGGDFAAGLRRSEWSRRVVDPERRRLARNRGAPNRGVLNRYARRGRRRARLLAARNLRGDDRHGQPARRRTIENVRIATIHRRPMRVGAAGAQTSVRRASRLKPLFRDRPAKHVALIGKRPRAPREPRRRRDNSHSPTERRQATFSASSLISAPVVAARPPAPEESLRSAELAENRLVRLSRIDLGLGVMPTLGASVAYPFQAIKRLGFTPSLASAAQ